MSLGLQQSVLIPGKEPTAPLEPAAPAAVGRAEVNARAQDLMATYGAGSLLGQGTYRDSLLSAMNAMIASYNNTADPLVRGNIAQDGNELLDLAKRADMVPQDASFERYYEKLTGQRLASDLSAPSREDLTAFIEEATKGRPVVPNPQDSLQLPDTLPYQIVPILRWGALAISAAIKKVEAHRSIPGHVRGRHMLGTASAAAGRSIFRKTFDVKKGVLAGLSEARQLAIMYGDQLAAGQVVRGGRVQLQISPRNKNLLEVTVNFGKAIGQEGETLMRIVVEKSGHLKTTYPIRTAAAGVFFGIAGLSAGDASAMYTRFDARVAATANQLAAHRDPSATSSVSNEVVGVVDPTGIFYADPANAGEGAQLILWRAAFRAVADIEKGLGRVLSADERQTFMRRFAGAVASTLAARG